MKSLYLLLIPVFLIAHGGEKHEEKKEVTKQIQVTETKRMIYSKINKDYLKNIKPILEKKCFDCHSDKTNYPWYFKLPLVSTMIQKDIDEAKEHLDFSSDYPFISHETPIKDLKSMLKVFEEKSMPSFQYRIMHSESKIIDNDMTIMKQWVENSLSQLENKDK